MGLIKKSNELTISPNIKLMIYGQAGMGKTTAALSGPKPLLLLDFDGGVKRVNMAHLEGVDIVQVSSWEDIQKLMQLKEELAEYKSIVVDTVGKMMDCIILHVCGNRQPQLKEWMKVNQEFSWFGRSLDASGKHIIYVAHRDSRKEGDETVFIPALREKSYNAILTELDLLGYLEMRSQQGVQVRTITFDPTSRNDGKNTCNLPSVMKVPTVVNAEGKIVSENSFIKEKVIDPYIAMLNKKLEERRRYDELIRQIEEGVEMIIDAESANAFARKMKEFPHVGSSKAKATALFMEKVRSLGLTFDKDSKIYHDAA